MRRKIRYRFGDVPRVPAPEGCQKRLPGIASWPGHHCLVMCSWRARIHRSAVAEVSLWDFGPQGRAGPSNFGQERRCPSLRHPPRHSAFGTSATLSLCSTGHRLFVPGSSPCPWGVLPGVSNSVALCTPVAPEHLAGLVEVLLQKDILQGEIGAQPLSDTATVRHAASRPLTIGRIQRLLTMRRQRVQ